MTKLYFWRKFRNWRGCSALYCNLAWRPRGVDKRTQLLGVRTVPVPHGPDGTVLRFPYPCRFELLWLTLTDGGRDGLGPFMPVTVCPSRPLQRVYGCLRTQTQSNLIIVDSMLSPLCCPPSPPRQHLPLDLKNQECLHRLCCGCSTCQAQSMAAVPTFTGDGGPILSLTGKQRTSLEITRCTIQRQCLFEVYIVQLGTDAVRVYPSPSLYGAQSLLRMSLSPTNSSFLFQALHKHSIAYYMPTHTRPSSILSRVLTPFNPQRLRLPFHQENVISLENGLEIAWNFFFQFSPISFLFYSFLLLKFQDTVLKKVKKRGKKGKIRQLSCLRLMTFCWCPRALHAIAAACAELVGPSQWGLGDDSSPVREEAKLALDFSQVITLPHPAVRSSRVTNNSAARSSRCVPPASHRYFDTGRHINCAASCCGTSFAQSSYLYCGMGLSSWMCMRSFSGPALLGTPRGYSARALQWWWLGFMSSYDAATQPWLQRTGSCFNSFGLPGERQPRCRCSPC